MLFIINRLTPAVLWLCARQRQPIACRCFILLERSFSKPAITKAKHLLVTIWANTSRLVIFSAIIVGAVIECSISSSDRSPSSLVHKMPIEANKGSMLVTFVLQKVWALFNPKFFQIPKML